MQTGAALGSMPGLDFNFDGINNRDGILPPDTNGDVGLNHYFQWVNLSITIWEINRTNHTLSTVLGPVAGSIFWSALTGNARRRMTATPSCCTITWQTAGW